MLIDVPDFKVTICGGIPWITSEEEYKYSAELTGIYTMADAAYVVSHLGKPDVGAAHLAGLEGAIKAYQAIVVEEPRAAPPLRSGKPSSLRMIVDEGEQFPAQSAC